MSTQIYHKSLSIPQVQYTTRPPSQTKLLIYNINNQWTINDETAFKSILNSFDATAINFSYELLGILQSNNQ